MKKIIILLFFSNMFLAQNYSVSPYYGEVIKPYYKYIPSQITFYDIASVVGNMDNLLHDELGLIQLNVKDNVSSDFNNGSFLYTYTSGAGSNIYRLYFKYNIVNYNDIFLVKSVEISGSVSLMTKFYLLAWPTKIQEGNLKKNELVKNYYLQDDISYQFHNGKPVITITNRQLKNIADFEAYRENGKANYLANHEKTSKYQKSKYQLDAEQKNTAETISAVNEVKPIEKQKASISEVYIVDVAKSTIKPQPNENVLAFIKDGLKDSKKGIYSIFVKDINADKIDGKFRLIQ